MFAVRLPTGRTTYNSAAASWRMKWRPRRETWMKTGPTKPLKRWKVNKNVFYQCQHVCAFSSPALPTAPEVTVHCTNSSELPSPTVTATTAGTAIATTLRRQIFTKMFSLPTSIFKSITSHQWQFSEEKRVIILVRVHNNNKISIVI